MQEKNPPLTDSEWRARLRSDEAFEITRHGATERPFTGAYWNHWESGTYACAVCARPLFDSGAKFDAGCGWPSYDRELPESGIRRVLDTSHGMVRTELKCGHCQAHLGHVFDDGPTATGERYCINSASLDFDQTP